MPRSSDSGRLTLLAAGLIVLCTIVVYSNSFSGPFIYDDIGAIAENPTIRRLWSIGRIFTPPSKGETVTGRPLLNLSLAINYAISGLEVWSYHVANLLIHMGAALLLLGILRRTFLTSALRTRFGKSATPLALACALLWALHPLQTESVTYVVQRAESLAGFFYLLTLYCVIRGARSAGVPPAQADVCVPPAQKDAGETPALRPCDRSWSVAAVLACLCGMATKEVMVTAPLIVLLYDRTFLAGSFAEALRRRWGLYLGLAATWTLLGYLVVSTGLIGRQPEMGAPDAWSYFRSQPGVIVNYLRLSVWPSFLCFDYAWPVADNLGQILPGAIIVGLLLAATVWGLLGRRTWGFWGAWFLLILAPTSIVLPLGQLAFEHRMYLPLAAVAVAAVAGGYALWKRLLAGLGGQSPFSPVTVASSAESVAAKKGTVPGWAVPVGILAILPTALGYATYRRNRDYQSALTIWQDTVDKRPENHVAHCNLAMALAEAHRTDKAVRHYRQSLSLKPDYIQAHNNFGADLAAAGQTDEAIEHFQYVLRLDQDDADAHNNLGSVQAKIGKIDEAIEHFRRALRLNPDSVQTCKNLGDALADAGRPGEAIAHYQQALRQMPDYVEAYNNLGNALVKLGRAGEAMGQYQEALRLKPDYAEAHNNLAKALADAGKMQQAVEHWNKAVALKPDYAEAHHNLGNALVMTDKLNEAIGHYREAVRLKPDYLKARYSLAMALDSLAATYAAAGRFDDAITAAAEAVQWAESSGQTPLAEQIRARLQRYRASRP